MINNNQSGVTIFVAILILSSIIVLAVAVSDIVVRTSQSSKKIGLSEVAYQAAETAVEKALRQIEYDRSLSGLNGQTGNLEEVPGASWRLAVSEVSSLTLECGDLGDNQGVCVDDAGAITPDNPLWIKLETGNSFQLDLDFAGLSLPNNLQISWNGTAKAVAYGESGQITDQESPLNLSSLDTNLYVIRVINEDSSLLTFEFKPAGGNLPIGILVTATGDYLEQERVLEVERANWQVY